MTDDSGAELVVDIADMGQRVHSMSQSQLGDSRSIMAADVNEEEEMTDELQHAAQAEIETMMEVDAST